VSDLVLIGQKNEELPSDVLFSLFIKFANGDRILILQKSDRRFIKVNDRLLRNTNLLAELLKITYLIPQMDYFFVDNHAIRRRFIDRTVTLLSTEHYGNVKKYDFFLRERMKILITRDHRDNWLDVVEGKIAELGTAIASARNNTVQHLNKIFREYTTEFPRGQISIGGPVESRLLEEKTPEVENFYRKTLFSNRNGDLKSKRTNFGIHRSTIEVLQRDKNIRAELCSTGEQKMLLLALVVIRTIFSREIGQGTTILLLDEVCSHIDDETRGKLFSELKNLGVQTFISGTNPQNFTDLLDVGSNSRLIEF
jgi:DNA replication and repair protein RecF